MSTRATSIAFATLALAIATTGCEKRCFDDGTSTLEQFQHCGELCELDDTLACDRWRDLFSQAEGWCDGGDRKACRELCSTFGSPINEQYCLRAQTPP